MADKKADAPKANDDSTKPVAPGRAAESVPPAVTASDQRQAIKTENARIEADTAGHLVPVLLDQATAGADKTTPGAEKTAAKPAVDADSVKAATDRIYTTTGARNKAEMERIMALLSPEDRMLSSIGAVNPFDLAGTLAVLQNKPKAERVAIDAQYAGRAGESLETTFRANLGGAELEHALTVLHRNDGDLATQRLDSINTDLAELKNGGSRSRDRVEEHLRDTLATSTKAQLDEISRQYGEQHKDAQGNPISLAQALDGDKSLSQPTKATSKILVNGSDTITQEQRLQIAQVGLDNHDILIFQEAMSFTTPETRKAFQDDKADQRVIDAFAGTYVASPEGGTMSYPAGVTPYDFQHALDYSRYGKLSAATEISENKSNDKVIETAIKKMTEEERRLYGIARDIAQNNPEPKNVSDADKAKAKDFTQLYETLKRTGKEPEFSDKIIGPEGGSLISTLAAAHRKPWYWVNSSTDEIQKDLAKVPGKDLEYFQQHPERVQDLEKLFRSLGKGDQDVASLMSTFNARLNSKNQFDRQQVEQRQQVVIDSLLKTTPEWQQAYRENPDFQEKVNGQVKLLLGKNAGAEVAQKLFDQIRCGEQPKTDLVDQLKLNTATPAKAISDVEQAFKDDPELARKVTKPANGEEAAYAQQVKDALTASTAKPGVDGISYAADAATLLTKGHLEKPIPPPANIVAEISKVDTSNPMLANARESGTMSTIDLLERASMMPTPDNRAPIDAIMHMSQQEQERFRTDLDYRKRVTDKATQLMQGPLLDSAKAMFGQIACGEQPSLDLAGKLTVNGMFEKNTEKAFRDIAQAFKDDPTLQPRLQKPETDADKRLAYTVMSGMMQIAASTGRPELRDDLKKLIATGHVPLERLTSFDKSAFSTDLDKTIKDILGASAEEKSALKTDKSFQDRALSGFNPDQRKALLTILDNGEAKPEDRMFFRLAGSGGSNEIMQDLRGIEAKDLPDVIKRAAGKYQIDLETKLHGKLDGEQQSEADRIFATNRSLGEQQDLARTQASQTLPGHGSFSELFTSGETASLQDSLLQSNKIFTDYQSIVGTLPEDQKQQLEAKVRKAQGILGDSIGNEIEAQKDAADTITNVGLGVVGITSVVATGGATLPLIAGVATVGGIAKVGMRSALMGDNYFKNQMGGDFLVGAVIGAGNVLGPGEVAGIFGLGKTAAANAVERTFQDLGTTTLKDAITDGAKSRLSAATQDLMKNALATGAPGISLTALTAAADRAVASTVPDRAAVVQKLLTTLQTNLDTQFKEQTANWARNLARTQGYNIGGGAIGSGSGALVEGGISGQSFNDTVSSVFSASALGGLTAFGMGNALHLGGKMMRGSHAHTDGPAAIADARPGQVSAEPAPKIPTEPTKVADGNVVEFRPAANNDGTTIGADNVNGNNPPLRKAAALDEGGAITPRAAQDGSIKTDPPASEWDLAKPKSILRDEEFMRSLQERYPEQFSPVKAQKLYDSIVEAQKTWKGDIPAMRNEAAMASADAHNNFSAMQKLKDEFRRNNVSAQDINAAMVDKDNALNKQGDKNLYDLYHNVIEARDKNLALLKQIEDERTARAKSLEAPLQQFADDLGLPVRKLSFPEPTDSAIGGYQNGVVELGRNLLDENVASLIGSTANHEVLHLRQDVDFIRTLMQKKQLAPSFAGPLSAQDLYESIKQEYERVSGKELNRDWYNQVKAYSEGKPPLTEPEMSHAIEVARSADYGQETLLEIQRGADSRNSARVISSWARRLERDADGSLGTMQDLARELNNDYGQTLQRRLFRNSVPKEFSAALQYAKSHNGEIPADQLPALKAQLLDTLRSRFQYENSQGAMATAPYFDSLIEKEAFATAHLFPKPEQPFSGIQPETKLRPEILELGRTQAGMAPGNAEVPLAPSLDVGVPAVSSRDGTIAGGDKIPTDVEVRRQPSLEPPVVAQKRGFELEIDRRLADADPQKLRLLSDATLANPEAQLYLLSHATDRQTAMIRQETIASMSSNTGLFKSEAWKALPADERITLTAKLLNALPKNVDHVQSARLYKQTKDALADNASAVPRRQRSEENNKAGAKYRASLNTQDSLRNDILKTIAPNDISALSPQVRTELKESLDYTLGKLDRQIKNPGSTVDNAKLIVDKHLGNPIDDATGARILTQFTGTDRDLAIAVMRERSRFLTQQGLNQELIRMGDELANTRFVSSAREAGNYGRETKKITAVVFGDATEGHELAYQFRKATGFSVDIKVVKTQADFDAAVGRNGIQRNNVVMFDPPPSTKTPLGQHIYAARDRWIEPQTLKDFRSGVNIHDMDWLVVSPPQVTNKLRDAVEAEKAKPGYVADSPTAVSSPVTAEEIAAMRQGIESARAETRDVMETQAMLFFAQEPREFGFKLSEQFANNVNYISRQQMMEDAFALHSRLAADKTDIIYVSDIDSNGSSHFITDLYKRANELPDSSFKSIAEITEMAKRGELRGKKVVVLDDSIYTGSQAIDQILPKLAQIKKAAMPSTGGARFEIGVLNGYQEGIDAVDKAKAAPKRNLNLDVVVGSDGTYASKAVTPADAASTAGDADATNDARLNGRLGQAIFNADPGKGADVVARTVFPHKVPNNNIKDLNDLFQNYLGVAGSHVESKADAVGAVRNTADARAFKTAADIAGVPQFAEVDDGLFRGGTPKTLEALNQMEQQKGVKVIVDLTLSGSSVSKEWANSPAGIAAGRKYVPIPMSNATMTMQDIVRAAAEIHKLAETKNVFVHCFMGRDRTSAVMAYYRWKYQGWSALNALGEMNQFGFSLSTPGNRQLSAVMGKLLAGPRQ